MKILYVEDHPAQRDIMHQMLEMSGYDVITASRADEGVRKAIEQRPDVILMDLRMPGKTGVEAIAELKAAEAPISAIPIVVLSAWGTQRHMEAAQEAGADAFLTKPVEHRRLTQTLEDIVANKE
jgi:CheY-like chemotaxis protein